jgi:hypothetical protein
MFKRGLSGYAGWLYAAYSLVVLSANMPTIHRVLNDTRELNKREQTIYENELNQQTNHRPTTTDHDRPQEATDQPLYFKRVEELTQQGYSERAIMAELNISKHKVRKAQGK